MAQLTPPTKMMFNISVILGVIAILLYFLGVFGIMGGGGTLFFAFWGAVIAWALLVASVSMKGI